MPLRYAATRRSVTSPEKWASKSIGIASVGRAPVIARPRKSSVTNSYYNWKALYVLLTGLQPFENTRREKPSLEEWLRQLREEEPPNPSTKVSGDKDTSTASAEARGTEPKQLVSLLRGDLDRIAMKALERDRTRRYGTPSELAVDLRRFLNHEPVVARPASAAYRLRKYTRRHRVAVGRRCSCVRPHSSATTRSRNEIVRTKSVIARLGSPIS